MIAHGLAKPALTEVKLPDGGEGVPESPQQARVLSVLIPHMEPLLPVLTATKRPVGDRSDSCKVVG